MLACRSRFRTAAFVVTQLCATALMALAGATDAPVAVGLRKQLLVDDHIIARSTNVTRVLTPAVKANAGQPIRFWSADASGQRVPLNAWIYASPYYDADRQVFRMWSRVYPDGQGVQYGYSESTDGIDFEFKSLLTGLHSSGDYNSVVYIDPHESDPAHRYKIGYDGAPKGIPNGATLAHSGDGIHWTPYNQGKPVTGRAADFTNTLIWDQAAQTYRLFTRTDFGTPGGLGEVRGMRGMTNPDVKKNPTAWQTTSGWLFDREGPDEHRRRQIYMMTDWIYADVHFGLFSVYEWPADFSEGEETDHIARHERDVLNYYLATSRDGDDWDLTWIYAGQPLVQRGGNGTWDKDMILPANWIVTHDDRHWIYYGGANERHGTEGVFQPQRDGSMGLATLPLDRFVGFQAGETPGTIVTKPFKLDGPTLQVNADCSGGTMSVEVLDVKSEPITDYASADARPLKRDDKLDWTPTFKDHQDLSDLVGRTIRLRFQLQHATVYAFRITRQ